MNLLLDTHAFIWFVSGDNLLSVKAKNAIENPSNQCYISVASLWEIAIKISLKKLKLTKPFNQIMVQIESNGFILLPISFEHTLSVSKLKFHHRDPFDRILASQVLTSDLILITRDEIFEKYKVKTIW